MTETSKKLMSADEVVVSTKVIASILDVSTRRINQMVEEGILEKIKTGSFNLVVTMRKYILYLKTKNDNENAVNSTEKEFEIEKMLHEKARRQKAELELALMQGSMHDAGDVEREMGKMIMAFKAKVLTIPSKISAQLAVKKDVTVIEDILKDELCNALQELSEYDPELFRHDTYVDLDNDGVVADGG
ncbi:MAG: hypothetical protein K0R69_3137 [Clostridia bacterium]|nr:hypothetical protein [Clostridia bacterium]